MRTIHVAGERYHYSAWPAVVRAPDGALVVSYCKSEEHVAPNGMILVTRSLDDGEHWSSPIVVRDSIIDDRECGMTALSDGRLLLHIYSTHHTPALLAGLPQFSYEADVLDHWARHIESREYREAKGEAGGWLYVSGDSGVTWRCVGRGPDTIHGGIELEDGRIVVAAYRSDKPDIGIHRADPADLRFERIAVFESPQVPGSRFGEPHIALLRSGRIVMMIRSTAFPYDDAADPNHLWVTWSDDGGASWAEAKKTPIWGFPPHLLVLSDGRVLCTYGFRRAPYGERACLSDDGITWDVRREVVLRDDADGGDLGYPATVELSPGKLFTVYYQSPHAEPPACMAPPDPLRHKPSIWGTFWEVD